MEQAFGLTIPRTLEEVCDRSRMALLIYDMQVGVLSQIKNSELIIARVVQVLQACSSMPYTGCTTCL